MSLKALAGTLNKPALLPTDALTSGAVLRSLDKLANEAGADKQFRATLKAAPVAANLVTDRKTVFWAYNGSVPGPLIDVFEGDTVEIRFENDLPQASTIHWHGLPVPPDQDGNPQDAIAPGGKHSYRFTLPTGSAGTYWYHPHPHGHTAEQVYRGLAGAFIVRARQDPLADVPERLLLISDLKLDQQGQIAENDANDIMNGREGQFVLVNGQHLPTLPFDGSGRERWRVWNACSGRFLQLTLPGTRFTLVGTDGGLIEHPIPNLPEILLAPGQRVELIVEAGTRRDRAVLSAAVYQRGKMGDVPADIAQPLLTVDYAAVTGIALAPLPTTLTRIPDLGPIKAKKRIVFSETMSMQGGRHQMGFLINGKTHDPRRIDLSSRRGEVELWEIANQADMDHPFHLHGTQFQVVEREWKGVKTPEPFRAWRDMVNLRAGETVRIKTVQHWRGIRMFHCHILEHEDMGMVGQLRVV